MLTTTAMVLFRAKNDVTAADSVHYAAQAPYWQRKGCLLKRLLHLAWMDLPEVATSLARTALAQRMSSGSKGRLSRHRAPLVQRLGNEMGNRGVRRSEIHRARRETVI